MQKLWVHWIDTNKARDQQVAAEWMAHYAERDYSVIIETWGIRHDRPLPLYELRKTGLRWT